MSKKIKWKKGQDWMDGSPTYWIEGRNPNTSLEDITLLIYRRREPIFKRSRQKEYVWYGEISERKSECGDRLGPFKTVTKTKKEMENAFDHYLEEFTEAV